MAKSTNAQEVSTGTSDSYTDAELSAANLRSRPMLGGELKSVGGASTQSSKSGTTSSDKAPLSHQAPAQTTESLYSQRESAQDSSADSTVGDGQAATLSQSDKTIVKPAPPKGRQARTTTMDDDDFAALQ
jgi:hypothetical protein